MDITELVPDAQIEILVRSVESVRSIRSLSLVCKLFKNLVDSEKFFTFLDRKLESDSKYLRDQFASSELYLELTPLGGRMTITQKVRARAHDIERIKCSIKMMCETKLKTLSARSCNFFSEAIIAARKDCEEKHKIRYLIEDSSLC